jgi:hypothetical protein
MQPRLNVLFAEENFYSSFYLDIHLSLEAKETMFNHFDLPLKEKSMGASNSGFSVFLDSAPVYVFTRSQIFFVGKTLLSVEYLFQPSSVKV